MIAGRCGDHDETMNLNDGSFRSWSSNKKRESPWVALLPSKGTLFRW
jgi:hypothetical protein